jgi:hypothetical protein
MEYTGLLGPPRDFIHVAERINLWWAIYILDRLISLGSALPPGVWGEEREVHFLAYSSMHILIAPVDYHNRLAEVLGRFESGTHLGFPSIPATNEYGLSRIIHLRIGPGDLSMNYLSMGRNRQTSPMIHFSPYGQSVMPL